MNFPSSILSIFLFFLAVISVSDAFAIPQNPLVISPEEDQRLNSSNLIKRGCVPSKDAADVCPDIPTVDFLVTKIQQHGKVGKFDSLFYCDLGGGNAMAEASDWYRKNVPNGRGSVVFSQIVNQKWYDAQGRVLYQKSPCKVDAFQKRLSQAFAQASKDTVYFFTKAGNKGTCMPEETAWGGWEFPALTRNSDVTQIIQVNPKAANDKGHVIWRPGDGYSPNKPRG